MNYQQLLVEHLALIERLVRFIARRRHLSVIDTEEFASFVHLKLVDKDFAILRKFQGRSSIKTYLTIVIERLCLDYCIGKWGKWRPSAPARRLGPLAVLLEQMIVRDGITFDEAVGTLQTNHGVSETRGDLHAMLLQLPVRMPRPSGLDDVDAALTAASARDIPTDYRDDANAIERVQAALMEALATLPPEDRQIVTLRFERSLPVSEIARALGVHSKPLYRRLEHIIRALRAELLQRGIDEGEIATIIGHPTLMLAPVLSNSPTSSGN